MNHITKQIDKQIIKLKNKLHELNDLFSDMNDIRIYLGSSVVHDVVIDPLMVAIKKHLEDDIEFLEKLKEMEKK